ncbi:uncharacterized protein [Amphiura filiformis]|uniref:uncharacterized protein n=1 Tax=Amphiura filiformis TaxID=82378 RepID=UPI003B221792
MYKLLVILVLCTATLAVAASFDGLVAKNDMKIKQRSLEDAIASADALKKVALDLLDFMLTSSQSICPAPAQLLSERICRGRGKFSNVCRRRRSLSGDLEREIVELLMKEQEREEHEELMKEQERGEYEELMKEQERGNYEELERTRDQTRDLSPAEEKQMQKELLQVVQQVTSDTAEAFDLSEQVKDDIDKAIKAAVIAVKSIAKELCPK